MSNTIVGKAIATVLDEILDFDPCDAHEISKAGSYLTSLGENMRRLQHDPSSYGWHVFGYISPQKTPYYLRTESGLARWPYGSQEICVLYVIGNRSR